MKFIKIKLFLPLFLFLFAATINFFNQNWASSWDTRWVVPTALSLLRERNTDLNEFLAKTSYYKNNYSLELLNGKAYMIYPPGVALISLPVVAILEICGVNTFVNLELTERIITSINLGLLAVLFYFMALDFLGFFASGLFALLAIFTTSLWSSAGTGLWQHGWSAFFIGWALLLTIKSRSRPETIRFVSLPLFYSVIVRPMNVISLFFISLYVLIFYRKFFLRYLFYGFLIFLPFVIYFVSIYHQPVSRYFLVFFRINIFNGHGDLKNFLINYAGALLSPARGLFIYSPVIIFSIWGLIVQIKKRDWLSIFLALIILVHIGVIASIRRSWGGHCYGPRYLTDMIPYLVYLILFFLKDILIPSIRKKQFSLGVVFIIFLLISFLMHFQGANSQKSIGWNIYPNNIDYNPGRIWDWRDPPFLRN